MELTNIEQPIRPLLDRYHEISQQLFRSDVQLIDDISHHVMAYKGKQLRPLLTLLTAAACGLPADTPPSHPIFRAAAAIELFHNASLLHDDVVDESSLRRGHSSVNHQWGNKVAVLMGDYYLSHVMRILFDINIPAVTHLLNDTVTQMSEGELLQQQCSGDLNTDTDTYLRIIRQKTALLLSACSQVGALLATSDSLIQSAAARFGLQLGIAFQIRDDILDLLPASATGKPQGNDLREHKATLPIILANKKSPLYNNIPLSSLLRKELDDTEIQGLIKHIAHTGAIEEAAKIQQHYLDDALAQLQMLPQNTFREALEQLTRQLQINPIQ